MRVPRSLLIALGIFVVLVAALALFTEWRRQPPLPEGLIQANGRLEGDEVTVAARFGGRVRTIAAREGDAVTAGQTLAVLEDPQAEWRLAELTHAKTEAQAQWRAARITLQALERDVPLQIQSANAGVTLARAALAKVEAAEQQARRDAERFRELAARGSLGAQKAEAAEAASAIAATDVDAARAALVRAERQLDQASLGQQRLDAQRQQLAAFAAQVERANALVTEATAVVADLTIAASSAGVVVTRLTDVGEIAAPGAPLFILVDLRRLYLKVYVPEPQIGRVRLGLPARVYTDAFPDHAFAATVRHIASRAEFTPKDIQTPDERVKLVYAVKLDLDENPEQRLTPGMPADAIIQCAREVPWTTPRR